MEIGVPETPILFTMMWVGDGGELPDQVKLGLKSYIDYGHRIQLFVYKEWKGIPEGVIVRNGNDIVTEDNIFRDIHHNSLAPFGDLFRWEFLYKEGGFWLDVDQVCISEKVPLGSIWYGAQHRDKSAISMGAIKVPKGDPVINELRKVANDPAYVAPWYNDSFKEVSEVMLSEYPDIKKRRSLIAWGAIGPTPTTAVLKWLGNYHKLAGSYDMTMCFPDKLWFHYFDGTCTAAQFKYKVSDYTWSIHWWEEAWHKRFQFLACKSNSIIADWWKAHIVRGYCYKMKCLAIIPVEDVHVQRFTLLDSEPLFMYSVHYAQDEGAIPVVVTNNKESIRLCSRCGIRCVDYNVRINNTESVVQQVLSKFHCDAFVVLQPIFPLRKSGLLASMFNMILDGKAESIYTAHGTTFDGSTVVSTKKFFTEKHVLLDSSSCYIPNTFPGTLSVTNDEASVVLNYVVHDNAFAAYHSKPLGPKHIAIIDSNSSKERDYLKFIDGCAKVMCVSNLDNFNFELKGRRIDFAVVTSDFNEQHDCYATKCLPELKKCDHVWFADTNKEWLFRLINRYDLERWSVLQDRVNTLYTKNFTLLGRAIELAHSMEPEAQLYIVGEKKNVLRSCEEEKERAEYLERIGVTTWILNAEDASKSKQQYSQEESK